MGYTTTFDGMVSVEPPLNAAEVAYLKKFNDSRRMKREQGPYYVDGPGFAGQDDDGKILDYNRAPDGQPGLWCQWTAADDGSSIYWDGAEKFYDAAEWMAYVIDHFLKPGAAAYAASDPQFNEFTFDHVLNGVIAAEGEQSGDIWRIVVTNNEVATQSGRVIYDES